jgi:PAS domain S-box-containing protein
MHPPDGDGDAAFSIPDFLYRDVFDAAPDGIVIVDRRGRICDVNRTASEMFGFDREELLGEPVERLVPEGQRELHREERAGYVDEPTARPMGVGLDLRARHADGSEFPVEISLSPLQGDDQMYVVASVRDQTEREKLRDFGAHTLQAVEGERQRIARELHDDTAQRLSALLLRIHMARSSHRDDMDEFLSDLRAEIEETVDGLRRVARGLRPPALSDLGLSEALRTHLRKRLREAGLEGDYEVDPAVDLLAQEKQLVLYRVAQEAVANVVRHAAANRVRVSVALEGDEVRLEIEDDGKGFRTRGKGTTVEGRGLGLIGIHERAHAVEGEAMVESAPGRGTVVRVTVPLDEEERARIA